MDTACGSCRPGIILANQLECARTWIEILDATTGLFMIFIGVIGLG